MSLQAGDYCNSTAYGPTKADALDKRSVGTVSAATTASGDPDLQWLPQFQASQGLETGWPTNGSHCMVPAALPLVSLLNLGHEPRSPPHPLPEPDVPQNMTAITYSDKAVPVALNLPLPKLTQASQLCTLDHRPKPKLGPAYPVSIDGYTNTFTSTTQGSPSQRPPNIVPAQQANAADRLPIIIVPGFITSHLVREKGPRCLAWLSR